MNNPAPWVAKFASKVSGKQAGFDPCLPPADRKSRVGASSPRPAIEPPTPSQPPTPQATHEKHEADYWLHVFEERSAIRQFDGGMSRHEADALGYEDVMLQWHTENALHTPDQCAGCMLKALPAELARLPDGAWVHASHQDCFIEYQRIWRTMAGVALQCAGVRYAPPSNDNLMSATARAMNDNQAPDMQAWYRGYDNAIDGHWQQEMFDVPTRAGMDYLEGWQAGNFCRHRQGDRFVQ